ncbi:MAG: pyruvate, water dikinase regulatory protein [Polyangiaceae bacterium]
MTPTHPRSTSIFVLSGGPGTAGRLLLDTLLAQFPDCETQVTFHIDLRSVEQLDAILDAAAMEQALIIHSFVDKVLWRHCLDRTERLGLEQQDLFGELMTKLERRFARTALSAPGRFRELKRDYYERIEALEFTIEHDDSQNLHSIERAEIVLVGVSRSGKTPLSIYLAMQGYKTANVSFLPAIDWPEELGRVDRARIVGLTIDRARLQMHRKQRASEVGLGKTTAYSSEEALFLELEALHEAFRKHHVPWLDVTEKPIETTAHEVIHLVTRSLGTDPRRH